MKHEINDFKTLILRKILFKTIAFTMIMKKYLLFVFVLFICHAIANGAPDEIVLRDVNHQNDHVEHNIPADQPDVYYDTDNQTIIIDGGGEVSYYDVEIISLSTLLTVITTQVNGTYDTIDVSTLATSGYTIMIYSPTNNVFEGNFYKD